MPTMDATAAAALDLQAIRPAFIAYLDILGDPVRATTGPANVQFAGTGDPDLDGHVFSAIDPTVVDIGDVRNDEAGGSDALTCSLSGLLLPDAELLATIADPANWRGREAKLWFRVRDENGVNQGAIVPYYTGYMVALDILPSPESQTIQLKIENYRALLTRASNRTYLDQKSFDPNDVSAAATISAANGADRGPGRVGGRSLLGGASTGRAGGGGVIGYHSLINRA